MKQTLHKKLTIIVFSFFCITGYSQQSITVKDSLTNEPLPFASVSLLNGFGLFADDTGKVQLDKDVSKIAISYVGYLSKSVVIGQVKNAVILLQRDIKTLSEVSIVAPKTAGKKRKDFTIKPLIHQNIDKMYWSSIGQQYAIFIPNSKKNGILKSVTIPLIVKDLHQGITETSFASDPYGTLVKFEFMTSVNQLPDAKINDYEKKVVIHSGKLKDQVVVDFEERIEISDEGIFVIMTIIGKTNKEGIYRSEMPYETIDLADRQKRVLKIILPNYALTEAPKGQMTLFRNVFSDKPWQKINKPMVYKDKKERPFYNIGIGYTFSGY